MTESAYYTVEDVATLLSVHPDTVRRWIKNNELRALNLGPRAGYRISKAALDDFIREHEQRSGGQTGKR
ncbi:MAG: helix-turn-helix domain-containing protein [Ktedonobacterales bacterium]